jgi:hypothetical protein
MRKLLYTLAGGRVELVDFTYGKVEDTGHKGFGK